LRSEQAAGMVRIAPAPATAGAAVVLAVPRAVHHMPGDRDASTAEASLEEFPPYELPSSAVPCPKQPVLPAQVYDPAATCSARISTFADMRPCILCPKCEGTCPTCEQAVYSDVTAIQINRQLGAAVASYQCKECAFIVRVSTSNYSRDSSNYAPTVHAQSKMVLVTGSSPYSAADTLLPPGAPPLLPEPPRDPRVCRLGIEGHPELEERTLSDWTGNDLVRAEMLQFFCSNPRPTFTNFETSRVGIGRSAVSEDLFRKFRHELDVAVCDEMLAECKDAQSDAAAELLAGNNAGAAVSVDGFYGSRNMKSEHSSVIVLSLSNQCMIAVGHMSLRAKEASGLTIPWKGTAKSSEAHLIRILLLHLVRTGFKLTWLVKDGDAGASALLSSTLPQLVHVDCFLHYLKNFYKRLAAGFKRKEVLKPLGQPSDVCICRGKPHASGCPCASDVHAAHLYNLVFLAAILAKKDPAKFANIVRVIKLHVVGDHSQCERVGLHASKLCSKRHEPTCARRRCACASAPEPCGTETGKGPSKCFGSPMEPTCEDAVAYETTSVSPLKCPYDVGIVNKELDKVSDDAHDLMLATLNAGTVSTAANENRNSIVAQHRMKGVNQGATAYSVTTGIGCLYGNQVPYVKMRTKAHAIEDCIWQFRLAKRLHVNLTEQYKLAIIRDVEEKVKKSSFMTSYEGRLYTIQREKEEVLRHRARKKEDHGVTYASMATVPVKDVDLRHLRVEPHGVCLLVFDCETAGFSLYNDTLMEISVKPVRITRKCDSTMLALVTAALSEDSYDESETALARDTDQNFDFEMMDGFSARSCVHAFATRGGKPVPGHSHLNLCDMKLEQTEKQLAEALVAYLQVLRDELGPAVPMVLVAHNGIVFDGNLLHQCFGRSGIDSRSLFEDVGVRGLMDTLPVSKKIDWAAFKTSNSTRKPALQTYAPPPQRTNFASAFGEALRFIDTSTKPSKEDVEEEHQARRMLPTQTAQREDGSLPEAVDGTTPDDPESEGDAADEGVGTVLKGRPAETKQRGQKLSHSLSEVYSRLFDRDFDAHIASEDVSALIDVLEHPLFTASTIDQEVVSIWRSLAARYDELLRQHDADVLGWSLQNCPQCEHGAMLPTLQRRTDASDAAPAAASGAATGSDLISAIERRWLVRLNCRAGTSTGACTTQHRGVREGYAPFREPSLKSGGGRAASKVNIVVPADACACKSKCKTNACPCVAAKRKCDPAKCIRHALEKCACCNKL
jgi:hypothetical protein